MPGEINVAGALTAAVVCPRAAWRWGAIGIFAIPGAYLVAEALGLETTLPTLARVDAALAFLGPIIVASVVSFLVIRYWPGRGPKSAHPHP